MNFKKYFLETANYNIDDFSGKWDKAVNESEELQVGLELV